MPRKNKIDFYKLRDLKNNTCLQKFVQDKYALKIITYFKTKKGFALTFH